MDEIWKDIVGYEGFYQVSNTGKVRSLDSVVVTKDGRRWNKAGKVLKPFYGPKSDCYPKVELGYNGCKKEYIHRLVAMAFIPNPDGLPEVNHIDEDKANNNVGNLEWCSRRYNNMHGTARARRKAHTDYVVAGKKRSKAVIQYDGSMNAIKEWESLTAAARELHCKIGNISRSCRTKKWKTCGYNWRYADEETAMGVEG